MRKIILHKIWVHIMSAVRQRGINHSKPHNRHQLVKWHVQKRATCLVSGWMSSCWEHGRCRNSLVRSHSWPFAPDSEHNYAQRAREEMGKKTPKRSFWYSPLSNYHVHAHVSCMSHIPCHLYLQKFFFSTYFTYIWKCITSIQAFIYP